MNRWAVIQHVEFEGPGLIADVAAQQGITLQTHRMDLGHPLPDAHHVDGLVVLGGPMSVHDHATHPWLIHEQALITACITRDIPVLGICLGAQLIARSLNAAVYRGPSAEVGLGTVDLTENGQHDPILGPAKTPLPVLCWHQDTFDLLVGATFLASSPSYPHQAFRLGHHTSRCNSTSKSPPACSTTCDPTYRRHRPKYPQTLPPARTGKKPRSVSPDI